MAKSRKDTFRNEAETYLIMRMSNGESLKRYSYTGKTREAGIDSLEQLLRATAGWVSAELYDNATSKVLWYYRSAQSLTRLTKEQYYAPSNNEIKAKNYVFNAYVVPTLEHKLATGIEKGKSVPVEDVRTIVLDGTLLQMLTQNVQKIVLYPKGSNIAKYEVIARTKAFVRCNTGEVIELDKLKSLIILEETLIK